MKLVQFCKYTGSVNLMEVERSTKIKAEMIQIAVNPAFDKDHKRRFMVIEKIFPDGQKIERVAALGGHSKKVLNPLGHYQLGVESLSQLAPVLLDQLLNPSFCCSRVEREASILFQRKRKHVTALEQHTLQ